MNYGMDFQGGDSGGGYTTVSSPAGSQQQGGGSQRTRRSYDEQTLIPVTIAMVLKSKSDAAGGDGTPILEDGRKATTVKLVAATRSFSDTSTNAIYELEDGTGLLDVKQWLDDNDCTAIQELRHSTFKDCIYLKVVGQIKDYEGKKQVVANSIRPLTSGNELTHHFLEVVYSAEKHKRADSIVSAPMGIGSINTGVGFGQGSGAQLAQSSGGTTGDEFKDQVLGYIRQMDKQMEAGVNISYCIKHFHGKTEPEIRAATDALSEEGHIYSTISENDFKPAD